MNVYDGTESESDDGGVVVTIKTEPKPIVKQESEDSNPDARAVPNITSPSQIIFKSFRLGYEPAVGDLAKDAERFCSFQMVQKYPYSYIGNTNRKPVDDTFFAQGKLYEHGWEFFYLYKDLKSVAQQPIILVLTRQFNHFLAKINSHLRTTLTIPVGAKGAFELRFGVNDGTPRPRYMGHADNKAQADRLKQNIPPSYYRPKEEAENITEPSGVALQAFREKVALLNQPRSGKNATTSRVNRERITKLQSWNNSIKRVQRYLGIRDHNSNPKTIKARQEYLEPQRIVKADVREMGEEASDDDLVIDTPELFTPEKPIRFDQERSVVFISVDVEAWERNPNMITELGFATLDTRDISTIPPGEGGKNWVKAIRPRHFRINEHLECINTDYVHGCADRFEFGSSEFIDLKDVPQAISSIFKHPFSKKEDTPTVDNSQRNIVLVGHDVVSDVNFLKTAGFDICTIPNLVEAIDTALMYRYFKRELNPRNLGATIADLGVVGWNLHNAGNDAFYTLRAMIAIAIKQLQQRQRSKTLRPRKFDGKRIQGAQDGDGWSSSENEYDGGEPRFVPPTYSTIESGKVPNARPVSRYSPTKAPTKPKPKPQNNRGPVAQAPQAPQNNSKFW
ncbi:hypothetical protein K3495_g5838 [Podosphaera aphanis]|nr:hypothetical protein K3495_g5838 [Podosphaera aphanis]